MNFQDIELDCMMIEFFVVSQIPDWNDLLKTNFLRVWQHIAVGYVFSLPEFEL